MVSPAGASSHQSDGCDLPSSRLVIARSFASHTSANAVRRDLVSASLIPPTSRRQVSAVKRRCIGSSFIEDKTACSKMFHGGRVGRQVFWFWFLLTEQRFLFVECRNPNLQSAKVVLHSRCAPAGSSALQASYRRSAWSRRSPHPHPLRRGPNFLDKARPRAAARSSTQVSVRPGGA